MAFDFGSFFGGMGGNQPGGKNFVGPLPKNFVPQKPAWQQGLQQLGAYQQQGGQGLPVIGPIMAGFEKHDELARQGRVLHTQTQIKQRQSRASQRDIVGKQVTGTAKSGLRQEGSTLDLINQTNLEFELDQAIMQHSYELQRDAMDRAGDKARISGFMQGGMDLGKMFMGGF